MKKLLIVLSFSTIPSTQAQTLPKKLTRSLLNGLFSLISSSDASANRTTEAHNLLEKIDPTKELLAVRKFNRFGKFLFGNNNTITIPYINYVIIDNEGAEKLSEESRRFALGRCMLTLRYQNQYLIYKYAISYILQRIYDLSTTEYEKKSVRFLDLTPLWEPMNLLIGQFRKTNDLNEKKKIISTIGDTCVSAINDGTVRLTPKKQAVYPLSIITANSFIQKYFSRKIEYDLDAKTAQTLDCQDGAFDFLENVENSRIKLDLSRLFYNFTALLSICASAILYEKNKHDPKSNSHTISACLNYLASFIQHTSFSVTYLPGQNSCINKQGGFGGYIPLIEQFFASFPSEHARIKSLKNKLGITLVNKLEKRAPS